MRSVMASSAQIAILPMQDLLALDSDSRMNKPGTCGDPNWAWRLTDNQLNDEIKWRLKEISQIFGRDGSYKDVKELFKI